MQEIFSTSLTEYKLIWNILEYILLVWNVYNFRKRKQYVLEI